MQAHTIAANNRELVEMNTYLLKMHREKENEMLSLQKQNLLLKQQLAARRAVVSESFARQVQDGSEEVARLRACLSGVLTEDVLKPLDVAVGILRDAAKADVIAFPSSSDQSRLSSATATNTTDSDACSLDDKKVLSASEVKENLRISGKFRPRKLISMGVAPLTPVTEMDNNHADVDDASNAREDSSLPFDHLIDSPTVRQSISLEPEQELIATTSLPISGKKSRNSKSLRSCSHRLSIFDFSPSSLRGSDAGQTSTLGPESSTLHDVTSSTLSPSPMNATLLQASFLDHESFRMKFDVGINSRSTEISDSSLDETLSLNSNNDKHCQRSIRSSCFGDLTFSPDATVRNQKKGRKENLVKKQKTLRTTETNGDVNEATRLSRASNSFFDRTHEDADASTGAADCSDSKRPRRERKQVSYKEPSMNRKLRRNF